MIISIGWCANVGDNLEQIVHLVDSGKLESGL